MELYWDKQVNSNIIKILVCLSACLFIMLWANCVCVAERACANLLWGPRALWTEGVREPLHRPLPPCYNNSRQGGAGIREERRKGGKCGGTGHIQLDAEWWQHRMVGGRSSGCIQASLPFPTPPTPAIPGRQRWRRVLGCGAPSLLSPLPRHSSWAGD